MDTDDFSDALPGAQALSFRSGTSDDPFDPSSREPSSGDVEQVLGTILSGALDEEHDQEKPEEDHRRDSVNGTVVAVKAPKAPRRKRKKHQRQQSPQSNGPTTLAMAQKGAVNAVQDLTDDDDDDDLVPDKRSSTKTSSNDKGKGKGKKIIVGLDPVEKDKNDNSGRRQKPRSSKHTSKVQDNGTNLTGSHSSRKRTRGDTVSKAEPRRSYRVAEKSAEDQIAQEKAKRVKTDTSAAPAIKASRRGKHEEYEVEKILDSRLDKKTGTAEYLVKWVGYPKSANTWEPLDNLTHCRQKLTQYHQRQQAK